MFTIQKNILDFFDNPEIYLNIRLYILLSQRCYFGMILLDLFSTVGNHYSL